MTKGLYASGRLVPQGSRGGSNVNPFKRMPLPPELAARTEEARTSGR